MMMRNREISWIKIDVYTCIPKYLKPKLLLKWFFLIVSNSYNISDYFIREVFWGEMGDGYIITAKWVVWASTIYAFLNNQMLTAFSRESCP